MADFELEPLEDDEPTGGGSGRAPKPWIFRADPRCGGGRERDGHIMEIPADAQPPVACEGTTCGCRYMPMPERRKGERRKGEDRREMLRFEKKADRRKGDRRKGRDLWKSRGR